MNKQKAPYDYCTSSTLFIYNIQFNRYQRSSPTWILSGMHLNTGRRHGRKFSSFVSWKVWSIPRERPEHPICFDILNPSRTQSNWPVTDKNASFLEPIRKRSCGTCFGHIRAQNFVLRGPRFESDQPCIHFYVLQKGKKPTNKRTK